MWSATYDSEPNPLLALEARMLRPKLGNLSGLNVLDVATGTGRWMDYAASTGASAFGVDASPEMLGIAAGKAGLAGRLILGDACALPLRANSIDLAICSFALGYLPSAAPALAEMARVAHRVVISDLHPEAVSRGWSRSFRSGGHSWSIEQFRHSPEVLQRAARNAGMTLLWAAEAGFGEPERHLFEQAGKPDLFRVVRSKPAVLATSWVRKGLEGTICT
jgi:ubiquinone/menaquinone biosynthesis C-methylase UbiE